jgi:hypothetical protein
MQCIFFMHQKINFMTCIYQNGFIDEYKGQILPL